MSDNMTEKYQKYYNNLLNGTLTDVLIKSISYQANIQLANDIIAEQEKTIQELETSLKDVKKELEDTNSSKTSSENFKISELKSQVSKLQDELGESNRLKLQYENIKHQVSHVDTFRNELLKERENHKKTRDEFEKEVESLNERIAYLQLTPAKRKKIDEEKNKQVEETIEVFSSLPLEEDITKDGGSF